MIARVAGSIAMVGGSDLQCVLCGCARSTFSNQMTSARPPITVVMHGRPTLYLYCCTYDKYTFGDSLILKIYMRK